MWKDFIALKSAWIYLTLVWFWGISWWPPERKTHFLRQFSRNFFEMCPHTIVRECNFDVQGSHESFVFELLHSHCGGICIYKQRFQSCILSVSATLATDMIVLQRKKCEKSKHSFIWEWNYVSNLKHCIGWVALSFLVCLFVGPSRYGNTRPNLHFFNIYRH